MKKLFRLFFLFFVLHPFASRAQLSHYVPTHYQGLFNMQPSSARATGMGLTTITLPGVENAFYNPATIGLVEEKVSVHLNYASGSEVYRKGRFPFIGATYRINDKLIVGMSTFSWLDDKDSPWTTIIGIYNEPVDGRRSQSWYNFIAAYEIIPHLQFGVSGNYLVDRSVGPGTVTNSEFILSAGAIYDRAVNFIKSDKVQRQNIRVAASLVNALMKNRIEQTFEDNLNFRDLPIHLTFGTAYQVRLPFSLGFIEGRSFYESMPRHVDLALHFQYRDVLKGPEDDVVNANHEFNSAFGIGAEAWFLDFAALRMGYYTEKRPSGRREDGGLWVTDTKRGFTWGFGAKLPLNEWTNKAFPFTTEVNLVTSTVLNEYANNGPTIESYFDGRDFLFAIGVNLKLVNNSQP
ncbi:hypothetical protein [Winogradskyella sp.]|uniref:hypothetical protein n=1 Tax=Winogradskyella sp. TaxID=1883156 RepID=UPI003BAB93B1